MPAACELPAGLYPGLTYRKEKMVMVYCPDPVLVTRLRAMVPSGEGCVATDCWTTFQRSAVAARALVAVLPGRFPDDQVDRLARLQLRLPDHPLVLAVDRDPESLRRLSSLRVDEMIWTQELDRHLWPTVSRARTGGALNGIASRFEAAETIPDRLRNALAAGVRATAPVHTVAQLASLVGRDRRTIWRLWQATYGPIAPLRLQDFVNWILLIRATALRAGGQRWSAVAADLDVHEHTIARLARSLAKMNLRQLTTTGPTELTRRFERQVVAALLDADHDTLSASNG